MTALQVVQALSGIAGWAFIVHSGIRIGAGEARGRRRLERLRMRQVVPVSDPPVVTVEEATAA